MDAKVFDELVAKRFGKCINTLSIKATEYESPVDRLHNFKVAAALEETTPRKALMGMMAKHTVSIYDMCKNDQVIYPDAVWDEKLTDGINYLILLEGLIQDEVTERVEVERRRIFTEIESERG